jgi:exodeoxyribonuclease-3
MKIATWNVNSIRARAPRVLAWLYTHPLDLLCLQETKVEDPLFPRLEFEAAGYHVTCYGQKTYNGVAFISREPMTEIIRGMNDGVEDLQARVLVGRFRDIMVGTFYVPNGQAVGTEKFKYKLAWLARWKEWTLRHVDPLQPWLFCGDINVAPDDRDVHDPEGWRDQVLCHPLERQALAQITTLGFTDVFRQHHPEATLYSWWDYRQLCFPKNHGLRIDHIFCTESLARRCRDVSIDREARKGKDPSDHAPVIAEFADL